MDSQPPTRRSLDGHAFERQCGPRRSDQYRSAITRTTLKRPLRFQRSVDLHAHQRHGKCVELKCFGKGTHEEGGLTKPPSCPTDPDPVSAWFRTAGTRVRQSSQCRTGVVESSTVEVVDPSGAFREHAKPRSRNLVADAETEAGPTDPAVALGRIKLAAMEFLLKR